MMKPRYVLIPTILFLVMFLGACKLPATYTPAPDGEDPIYTAAAQTVAAQLSGVGEPTTEGETVENNTPISPGLPSETLPATSTPLPTKTPIPTDTLPPTPTSEVTVIPPTEQIDDPVATLGEPTWKDDFQSGVNWPLYYDEHVNMQIDNGRLMMTANYADKWDSWMLTEQYPTDFYIEAIATPGECSYLDRYGVLVRAPDPNRTYLFGFSCDGKYALRLWDGENFYMLTTWDISPHILKGADQTNRLGLKVDGDVFTLYANGELLTVVQDDTFSEGQIGLFVGAVKTPGFTTWFDEVGYWDLP